MKRFRIELISQTSHSTECYRLIVYETVSGKPPLMWQNEMMASDLTAVEVLTLAIKYLGLTSQATDELSREAVRSANVQEREALLAIAVAKCPHCSATGDDIRLDYIYKAGHEAFVCRLCEHNWTEY